MFIIFLLTTQYHECRCDHILYTLSKENILGILDEKKR